MADFPLYGGGGRTETIGINTGTTAFTTVTAGARAYGSYAELSAATSFEYHGIFVNVTDPSLAYACLKLAIGAAGSEVDIATEIPLYGNSTRRMMQRVYLPINIPAGSRVSVAMSRDTGTTGTYSVSAVGVQGGPRFPVGFQRAKGYGTTAASPGCTVVTANAAGSTKGNYAQLTASTTYPMRAMIVCSGGEDASSFNALFDVAVGAAASEVDVVSNLPCFAYSSTVGENLKYTMLPCDIPSGTRLSARVQSSAAVADTIRVAVIGLD